MLSDRPLMWGIFSSKARHFRDGKSAQLRGLLMFSIKSASGMDGSKRVLPCGARIGYFNGSCWHENFRHSFANQLN